MKKETRGYKAFDSDLMCRDMQYEVGKEYEHKGQVAVCKEGLHMCPEPIDLLNYYGPYGSNDKDFCRFGVVNGGGECSKDSSKMAFQFLKVVREMHLDEYVRECLARLGECGKMNMLPHKKAICNVPQSVAMSFGICSAALTSSRRTVAITMNDSSLACAEKSGTCAVSYGNFSIASALRERSVAVAAGARSEAYAEWIFSTAVQTASESGSRTAGDSSVAVSLGPNSTAEADGMNSIATAVGMFSKARITGNRSVALCTGYRGTGESRSGNGIVICTGKDSLAMGKTGDCLIFVDYDDNDRITELKVIRIDGKEYMPDTWYDIEGKATGKEARR